MTRVLIVHATPLSATGGAEISLRHHIENKPDGVTVGVILPDQDIELGDWDVVLLANLRPAGGKGEHTEFAWVDLWLQRLRGYQGRVVRTERDIHSCAMRDGRCIRTTPLERMPCECGPRIPGAFEALYDRSDKILFLSPLHRDVISLLVPVRSPHVICAPPIDFGFFKVMNPSAQRPRKALIIGDHNRAGSDAVRSALSHGYTPEHIQYLSVQYADMPGLLNRYQAVVIRPVMFHAFGRIVVEAMACGCQTITNDRVGAMSWKDPVAASRRSNQEFWAAVLN